MELAERNLEDYLSQTIPHEYAHFVAHYKWGNRISAHGYEWQSVMIRCFNLSPDRCHNYDVSEVKSTNKIQRHFYCCSCGHETNFSTTIHNRIQSGRIYLYAKCRHNINKSQYLRSE